MRRQTTKRFPPTAVLAGRLCRVLRQLFPCFGCPATEQVEVIQPLLLAAVLADAVLFEEAVAKTFQHLASALRGLEDFALGVASQRKLGELFPQNLFHSRPAFLANDRKLDVASGDSLPHQLPQTAARAQIFVRERFDVLSGLGQLAIERFEQQPFASFQGQSKTKQGLQWKAEGHRGT